MRKSGWAAAAGLVSAALLLTACGGGSSSTTGSGTVPTATSGTSGAGNNSTSSAGAVSTATSGSSGSNGNSPSPHASGSLYSPPPGVLYFSIRHSTAGYVLTENGMPVYEYAGDSKGKAPSGTSGTWISVHSSNPQPSLADNLPGTLGTLNGVVTYNGYPLYTYGTQQTLQVHQSSQWKLIKLSASNIKTG